MRLGRIGIGMFVASIGSMGSAMVFGGNALSRAGSDWDSIAWREPIVSKSKPNKVSQAKRRKYKRQGRG
ncbi:hypothetical protein G9F31_00905 [Acinetobacter sp. 187]|uniref:hypothetical protein n=1 Tax=Acinetobacter lanii TaxID=2715163 RepID=UPI001408DDAD|nr:hypothetical protein [Acinetobacter lanii]NHC02344.1 hypothetical protein [Acinetobacter lanii]